MHGKHIRMNGEARACLGWEHKKISHTQRNNRLSKSWLKNIFDLQQKINLLEARNGELEAENETLKNKVRDLRF